MSEQRNAVLIFSKNPVEGDVKTRLIPDWGTEGAMKIYKDVLKKTIETVKLSDEVDVYIYCTPDLDDPFIQFCANQYELKPSLQRGRDLGERMANAIADLMGVYNNVIIVGSDCPELNIKDINLTIEKLNSGHDLVIGPSEDGGYYLIAMNKNLPVVFENIDWGSEEVLSKTRKHIVNHKISAYELEIKWDLDRPEDVHRYFRSRVLN